MGVLPSKKKVPPKRKFADVRKTKGARSNSPVPPGSGAGGPRGNRFYDPTVLSRGMSARVLGAGLNLSTLPADAIERDLRHMEAYSNACITYHQQFFQHVNRALVTSGHYGNVAAANANTTRALPIRIDPEEEKRVALLRKRIATAESIREVLETEYLSLRAHYVHTSHEVKRTRQSLDTQTHLLKTLVQARGKVVALRRARCQIVRDIYKALVRRTTKFEKLTAPVGNEQDLWEVWHSLEQQLKDAERAALQLEVLGTKKKKKRSSDDDYESPVVPWNARFMPKTPNDVPVFLSQLSAAPDRGAGFATNGVFGSKGSTMCYLTSNLPETLEDFEDEKEKLKKVEEDGDRLQRELEKERSTNRDLQDRISAIRKTSDEYCSMMTLIRGETEAVLQRHNILLDTPELRKAAQDAHKARTTVDDTSKSNVTEEGELVDEETNNGTAPAIVGTPAQGGADDDVNDGDDEGGADDDEEESMEAPPSEVIVDKQATDVAVMDAS
mmetsp:Transcript_33056/g.48911  ORF Transcript_33056/g.48911 Transcript_33056/m.48911 type:complete len:499 (-) Transcript_33056:117-1613(-)